MSHYMVINTVNSLPENESCYREILDAEDLHVLFQPIVDVKSSTILGYEALIRGPENSHFHTPDSLFTMAALLGLENELELICRKKAIQGFAERALPARLFLNISPGVILNPEFKKGRTLSYLREFEVDPGKVVIELTEQQKIFGFQSLVEALKHYRQMGFTVALDDLGAGYSSLRLWTELLPDYIKLDKHFIRNIHQDRIKSGFVSNMHRMSAVTDCLIIAEGVELAEELAVIQEIGIPFAQGYFFARPNAQPPRSITHSLGLAQPKKPKCPAPNPIHNTDVGSIARKIQPLPSSTKVNDIVKHLQEAHEIQLLPIINGNKPAGIINRHLFFNKLMATRFGVDLYSKHPVSKLLETSFITVDINDDLESVSKRLIATPVPEQAFIITEDEHYYGVATVLDLLETITEQKIQDARHANPLTLLPGIVPINKQINRSLEQNKSFSVLYFDLDNFKPYNDYYGYDAGDGIIKLLAELLSKYFTVEHSLTGHIGGDDFIVVDFTDTPEIRAQQLLDEFASRILDYYDKENLAAGGLTGNDRSGKSCFFPLTSISIGIVPKTAVATCKSHIDIADLANLAKKQAKKISGNSCFVDRRNRSGSPRAPGRDQKSPQKITESDITKSA